METTLFRVKMLSLSLFLIGRTLVDTGKVCGNAEIAVAGRTSLEPLHAFTELQLYPPMYYY